MAEAASGGQGEQQVEHGQEGRDERQGGVEGGHSEVR